MKRLIFILLFLVPLIVNGQLEHYNERIVGSGLSNGGSMELFDAKYFDIVMNQGWQSTMQHRSVKNYVRLALKPDAAIASDAQWNVVVKVTYEELVGTSFVSHQQTKTLHVSYAIDGNVLIDDASTPTTPTLRVEFEILNNPKMSLNGSKVLPDFGMPGKGAEFMTTDPVKVRLINVQPLR